MPLAADRLPGAFSAGAFLPGAAAFPAGMDPPWLVQPGATVP